MKTIEINGRLYSLAELEAMDVAVVRGKRITVASLYKKWRKSSEIPFSLYVENYCRDARCLNPIGNMSEPPKIQTYEDCVQDVLMGDAYDLETRTPNSVLERLVIATTLKALSGDVKAADSLYKWSGQEKQKIEGSLDIEADVNIEIG